MMWITFIAGALLFVANADSINLKTEEGATALLYTMVGLGFGIISVLYLSGLVS